MHCVIYVNIVHQRYLTKIFNRLREWQTVDHQHTSKTVTYDISLEKALHLSRDSIMSVTGHVIELNEINLKKWIYNAICKSETISLMEYHRVKCKYIGRSESS